MAVEKVVNVNFSLPYRKGMETEPGFNGKAETASKTYPDEKVFAKFQFPLNNSIVIAEKDALEAGYKMLRQNKQRSDLIGTYAKKFGISAPGASGGLTKINRARLGAMLELTQDCKKITAAMAKAGVTVTPEEIKEVQDAMAK